MESDFWHERWANNEIAFHNTEVHTALTTHWHTLPLPSDITVLVPLCGKSIDCRWLADQGHSVIGIELSKKAIEDFFVEQQIEPTIVEQNGIHCYQYQNLALLCADFFDITLDTLTTLGLTHPQAIYDRAALIALPDAMRQRYIKHLQTLLPNNVDGILVTLDYHHPNRSSPPFPINDQAVDNTYGCFTHIQKIEAIDLMNKESRFTNSQYEWGFENIYRLGKQS